MKQLFPIAVFAVLLFSSCQKVIDVNLNDAAPQYVVEANLFEGTNAFNVHVAKTTDYFGTSPQQQVNDAIITLSDEAGNSVTIPFTGNGNYTIPAFTAVKGSIYKLEVQAGGNTFTASSKVVGAVPIDSVSFEYKEAEGAFLDAGYDVVCYLSDPAGDKNNYRLILTQNDTLQNKPNDLYLFDDKYNNGKLVKANYRQRFRPGDNLKFELRTMDDTVYEFYKTLANILSNQNGPAPANPLSNFSGGALGYFGAFSVSKAAITLPIK